MAARKSCTHMTWAEAKAKVGGGGGSGGGNGKANKNPPKHVPHNQILAQKIIAKQQQQQGTNSGSNAGGGGGGGETLLGKKSLRKLQREDEKAMAALAAAKEERERERRNRFVRPYEQAQERMQDLVTTLVTTFQYSDDKNPKDENGDDVPCRLECIGMQLDEIMALEAIFHDTQEFQICQSTQIENLRSIHERYLEDEQDPTLIQQLMNHPPISFAIQVTIPDDTRALLATLSSSTSDPLNQLELVACIVVHVTLPPLYPHGDAEPVIRIHDCMVVDRNMVCSPDKPLETLAFLCADENRFQQALTEQIQSLLPYPCVYEVAVTWLTENIFQYLELRPYTVLLNLTSNLGNNTTSDDDDNNNKNNEIDDEN